MKLYNNGHNPFNFFATFKAPVDLVYGFPFSINTNELRSFAGRLYCDNISCPCADCKEAKLK